MGVQAAQAVAKARSVRELLVRHPFITVFVIALAARVVVAILFTEFFIGTYVPDSSTYHDMAKAAALGETSTWNAYTHALYWSTATFLLPVTFVYKVLGPVQLAGQALVAVAGGITAVLVARLGREALPQVTAVSIGLLVGLLPSQVLWSSLILKDAFVWALLAGIALLIAIATRKTSITSFALPVVGIFVLLLLLTRLRQHTSVVAAIAIVLASWVGARRRRWVRAAAIASAGILVPWFTGLGPAGLSLVAAPRNLIAQRAANTQLAESALVDDQTNPENLTSGEVAVNSLENLVAGLTRAQEEIDTLQTQAVGIDDELRADNGGKRDPAISDARRKARALRNRVSGIERRVDSLLTKHSLILDHLREIQEQSEREDSVADENSFAPNLAHLPIGLAAMLLRPYPWSSGGSTSMELARTEMTLWYALLALAFIGLPLALRYPRVSMFPLLAGAGITVMYALTEGNLGTAYRHRGEFVWVVVLLAGFGLYRLRQWTSRRVDTH